MARRAAMRWEALALVLVGCGGQMASGPDGGADVGGDVLLAQTVDAAAEASPDSSAAADAVPDTAVTCGHVLCAPGDFCDSSGSCHPPCEGTTPTECEGACVDVATHAADCGGCGIACPAGIACVSSTCACPSPSVFCRGQCTTFTHGPSDNDNSNCGGCGIACQTGTLCTNGYCAPCSGGQCPDR